MKTPVKITPDENGYYHVELLRTGEPTAMTGRVYGTEGVRAAINSPGFLSRLSGGQLRGTLGGLKGKRACCTAALHEIVDADVGVVFKSVTMTDNVVRGEVDFTGPCGEMAKSMFERGEVVFGMRASVTGGPIHREVKTIVTWDLVAPPPKKD